MSHFRNKFFDVIHFFIFYFFIFFLYFFIFCFTDGICIFVLRFYENHENFMKFMIFDMSKHQVFLRKYLILFKVSHQLSRCPLLFVPKSCFSAHFGVLGPKSALLGPKWDLGAPGAKLLIKVRFWELFWGPRSGKTDFWPKKAKFHKIS